MKYSEKEQKQKAANILIPAFVIIMLILLGNKFISTINCIAAQKLVLAEINNDVKSVILSPYYDGNSLVSNDVVINDSATITKLVSAYKHVRQQKGGDGRLPGQWQVILTFVKEDGAKIDSYVHHNEYSDLIFMPTPQNLNYNGLQDFFSSNKVSQILMARLATKQTRLVPEQETK